MSIHDVTPAMTAAVQQLWALCRACGVLPALLVVPDWHGEWPLGRHHAFVEWVRECHATGAEIVLHGERHDEVGLPRTFRDSIRAVGRTAREGEFLTLEYAAATERIERGMTLLTALSLPPVGFIAPAWLSREATHQAVADLGLQFSEDALGVRLHSRRADASPMHRTTHDLANSAHQARHAAVPRVIASPVVRWSARTTWRANMSRLVTAARWRTWQREPVVRLALHPQDLAHPVAAASVAREVQRWTAARDAVAYGSL